MNKIFSYNFDGKYHCYYEKNGLIYQTDYEYAIREAKAINVMRILLLVCPEAEHITNFKIHKLGLQLLETLEVVANNN